MSSVAAILAGGMGATLVSVIGSIILQRMSNKASKMAHAQSAKEVTLREIREEMTGLRSSDEAIQAEIEVLKASNRYLFHEQIARIAREHIARGAPVEYGERKNLLDMHAHYHDELRGNGSLDDLMAQFKKLPAK